jgi:hypothetical protein
MKLFTYKVGIIKEEEKEVTLPMTGIIEIEIPTYKERLSLIKDLGFSSADEGEEGLEKAKNLIEIVEKRVRKVEIKLKNGEEIKSLEDLGYYKEGTLVINDIGRLIISGFELGKL